MMNSFTFDGINSLETFDLYISEKNIYSAPERDMTFTSVPGRNGDVIIDNGRYQNASISYTVSFLDLPSKAIGIKQWLLRPGYKILSDSYQPGWFRYAVNSNALDISELVEGAGSFQLVFNCKPLMYSDGGQIATSIAYSGTTMENEYMFDSLPLIVIHLSSNTGNTTLFVTHDDGSQTEHRIKALNDLTPSTIKDIYIDSELMSVYNGSTLLNQKIDPDHFDGFPILKPGTNTISWSGNVTSIDVTPRWCTL